MLREVGSPCGWARLLIRSRRPLEFTILVETSGLLHERVSLRPCIVSPIPAWLHVRTPWNAVVKGSCQEALVNNNGVDNGHLGLTCIREA